MKRLFPIFLVCLLLAACGGQDSSLDSVDDATPYMVLIGDSIAEGHPIHHGRLHPQGEVYFDANYPSLPGQLSYELSSLLDIEVVNHGIGGQTTSDVRSRWGRDVLHKESDPGDGRGSSTLDYDDQLPHAVYVHAGVNDVTLNTPVDTIKDNFLFYAQSCKENGIILIVSNIGGATDLTEPQIALASEINAWLADELKTLHPEVQLIDYQTWASDGTGSYTTLKPGMFADNIHPNEAGAYNLAVYAAARIEL